jgi:TonB family protein
LRQELQAVHEFEADDKVLRNGIDAKKYQLLIIEKAAGTRLYSMANSFNHGSLKKRITMMLKEKSSPWARAKYAVVLPLAAIALLGFAQPEFTTLQARSAGEFDQLLSWTDASGHSGPSSTTSSSASPNANPSPQDKSNGNSEQSKTIDHNSDSANPLVVLNDVPIDPSVFKNLNFKTATQDDFAKALNIAPSDIRDIGVWKGDDAVTRFGANGRNGVLLISTTKSRKEPVPEVNNLQVSGLVVNVDDNTPVADANIAEVNKDKQVLTLTKSGSDGRFNLTVKNSNNLLIISHLNYNTGKVFIEKEMKIFMTNKKNMLDEIVVSGLQRVEDTQTPEASKKESELAVEMMPQYPGGQEELTTYIRNNLRYPSSAIDKGVQGRVICSFTIDVTGEVTDVKVLRGLTPALDAEAVRVVAGMPNWKPGRQNGKNCAVQYTLPITFKLEQYTVTAKKK